MEIKEKTELILKVNNKTEITVPDNKSGKKIIKKIIETNDKEKIKLTIKNIKETIINIHQSQINEYIK